MFALWPAHLYDCHGGYLQPMRVAYALRTLISDDRRIFLRKAVVDGILRFHEADPALAHDRAIVVDTYRQLDAAGL